MLAKKVVMVRPAAFGFNTETASTNHFQSNRIGSDLSKIALEEFDQSVNELVRNGIEVVVMEDDLIPPKPDAVFPNNWFSTHENGWLITYPMLTANRRYERRPEIQSILEQNGFVVRKHVALEKYESENLFLEGTGSLVFDHNRRICFAAVSPRTSISLAQEVCNLLDYNLIHFETDDGSGNCIYHTNVVIWTGQNLYGICGDVISDYNSFVRRLPADVEVLNFSNLQMEQFCGNMLMLANNRNEKCLCMSETSWQAMDFKQQQLVMEHAIPVRLRIPTIEQVGGGSARCMLAEIFPS